MKQSQLFTKVSKTAPADEVALNAQLLIRGGFVQKVMAGVYTFLPLGLRVLNKIEAIVRREMNAIGGQELLMPALHPKELWEQTKRWNEVDVLFKVPSRHGAEYALGPTHEETVVPTAQAFLSSYRDLPFAVYQIQTKFRDEARAKSGILRGREFRMKDLYSFHATPEDLQTYYEQASRAYANVFAALSLDAIKVEASGGSFSKFSHEYQVLNAAGEDVIYYCAACGFAKNKEIVSEDLQKLDVGATTVCPQCGGELRVSAGIEVGNIFQLNTKFSEPFNLMYTDAEGKHRIVYMGCYGIGISRLMGVLVEQFHDEKGIVWPEGAAPYTVHLIELQQGLGASLYDQLHRAGVEVLYDDRDASAGEKFATADLLGMPYRLVVSAKTNGKVEVKKRSDAVGGAEILSVEEVLARFTV